jgi:hypothetical protein
MKNLIIALTLSGCTPMMELGTVEKPPKRIALVVRIKVPPGGYAVVLAQGRVAIAQTMFYSICQTPCTQTAIFQVPQGQYEIHIGNGTLTQSTKPFIFSRDMTLEVEWKDWRRA